MSRIERGECVGGCHRGKARVIGGAGVVDDCERSLIFLMAGSVLVWVWILEARTKESFP